MFRRWLNWLRWGNHRFRKIPPWEVTPNDYEDLAREAKAIYVSFGGNLRIISPDNVDTIFENVAGGTLLPVRIKRVMSTQTTAAGLIALA